MARLLLGVTGGIAAYKALEFARLVQENISDLPAGALNVVTGDGPTAGRAIVWGAGFQQTGE